MALLSPLYDSFKMAFGERLKRLGFPGKPKATGSFIQNTPAGHVAIFAPPIFRGPIGVDVSARFAISNDVIQSYLSKTEIYSNPGKLTWSCGALISSTMLELKYRCEPMPDGSTLLRRLAAEPDVIERQKLTGIWLEPDADLVEIARVADHAYWQVEQFAWPTLQQYGFSDAEFLELTRRTDSFANSLFLAPRRELSGLLLARNLGRTDVMAELFENARRRFAEFAARGNEETSEQFERLVKVLGLT